MNEKIREKIFEAIGQASMCWSPKPKGIFSSAEACRIANDLLKWIEEEEEKENE